MKLLSLVVLGVSVLFAGAASACSCEEWVSAKKMVDQSTVAFVGIPSSNSEVVEPDVDEWGTDIVRTEFSVVRSYKGSRSKKVAIYSTADEGANCGATFAKDDGLWIVFAYKNEAGKLETTSCSLESVSGPTELAFVRELNRL